MSTHSTEYRSAIEWYDLFSSHLSVYRGLDVVLPMNPPIRTNNIVNCKMLAEALRLPLFPKHLSAVTKGYIHSFLIINTKKISLIARSQTDRPCPCRSRYTYS